MHIHSFYFVSYQKQQFIVSMKLNVINIVCEIINNQFVYTITPLLFSNNQY